jgi:hypothetical protein
MIRYAPPQPRVALGFAAVLMTALTLGGLVVLPAQLDAESATFGIVADANAAPAPSSRCAMPASKCMDAEAMPERGLSTAQALESAPKCDDEG